MTMSGLPQTPRQATSQDLLRGVNNEERYQEQLINAHGDKSPREQLEKQQQISQLRTRTAERVLELETQIAQLKGIGTQQAVEDAQIKFEQKKFDIQLENATKIAAIQEKEIETLKSSAEKLVEVLFTKPKNFAKDLGSVLHQAVLKPAVDAVSSGAAHLLQPLIYGANGNGGISGIFHPNQDPIKLSTEQNTSATV
jgi:hypothetical protein